MLQDMKELIDEKDYNPRTKQFMFDDGELNPNLSMLDCLDRALSSKSYTPQHLKAVQSALKYFKIGTEKKRLDYIKIKDVELIHIKQILESCNLTNYSFNKYKKYLSSLFTDLVDAGCLKINPCTGIKAKKHITEIKDIFTDEELQKISKVILWKFPDFNNFFQIFYMSGCRVSEIMSIKKKDVNIEKSEFKILLKKGGIDIKEKRAIIADAIIYWKDQLSKASDDDYIFSSNFQPGPKLIDRDYVYKYWKRNIRIKTIYTLKHTFLDKVEEANYNAQIMAGHRDDRTTSIYTVGREKRRLEAQKQIKIKTY